jgi:DNA adenine methylase
VEQGKIYQHCFQRQDHERLAEALKTTRHAWVLSYDDCPEIRELYDWADISTNTVKYTIGGIRTKQELLITRCR